MYSAKFSMLCIAKNLQYNGMILVQAAKEGDTESVNNLLEQGAGSEEADEVICSVFNHPISIK